MTELAHKLLDGDLVQNLRDTTNHLSFMMRSANEQDKQYLQYCFDIIQSIINAHVEAAKLEEPSAPTIITAEQQGNLFGVDSLRWRH